MFYSADQYPAIAQLAHHWQTIRGELDGLQEAAFLKWPQTDIYDGNWRVFPLYKFGTRVEANCLLCPETAALLESVPGMVTGGFSALSPGTYIGPHHGFTNEVLRCHVGLRPAQDCAIRVGSETRSWTAGSCFVFDDTLEHEAWNRGATTRIVLLFDFKRDPSREVAFPAEVYSY